MSPTTATAPLRGLTKISTPKMIERAPASAKSQSFPGAIQSRRSLQRYPLGLPRSRRERRGPGCDGRKEEGSNANRDPENAIEHIPHRFASTMPNRRADGEDAIHKRIRPNDERQRHQRNARYTRAITRTRSRAGRAVRPPTTCLSKSRTSYTSIWILFVLAGRPDGF